MNVRSQQMLGQTLGRYDNPYVRTPNLDRLAEQGVSEPGLHAEPQIPAQLCDTAHPALALMIYV